MLRNMAFASLSAASAALLLVLFIVAGRTLGDVEFGKFSFALALGTIFETLMDFGLHQVTIRAVARDRAQATDLLHHTLGIKLVWGGVALASLSTAASRSSSLPSAMLIGWPRTSPMISRCCASTVPPD